MLLETFQATVPTTGLGQGLGQGFPDKVLDKESDKVSDKDARTMFGTRFYLRTRCLSVVYNV